MITVAAVSPSLDLTYLVKSFVLGRISRTDDVYRCAGGKAFNMARAAAALGTTSTVVAMLGGPTGSWVAQSASAAGLEVVAVETSAETRTCVSIAAEDTGELSEVYQNAGAVSAAVWQRFTAELAATVRLRPGWLSISGSTPHGLADDAVAELIRLGFDAGVRVAVDTHGPRLRKAVEAAPTLVKVNRQEAAELLAVRIDTDLVSMAKQIRTRTGGTVVLTDGRNGAAATDGHQAIRSRLDAGSARFAVGSGDAFLGGLVSELDRGLDLVDALRTATAAGAANAQVPGPGVLDAVTTRALRHRVAILRG